MEQEKKTLVYVFILLFIVISLLITGTYIVIKDQGEENRKACIDADLEEDCYWQDVRCAKDCKYMNKEFHHLTGQGFGADDCFCKNKNGEIENIW